MSINDPPSVPDYDLADEVFADTAEQLKAVTDATRTQILNLVLERAATVTELAEALDRPKSSVAYHVKLLHDVGMLQVVRTRKVRAIEERFYGRTGRTIVFGDVHGSSNEMRRKGFIAEAHAEAPFDGDYLATLRHARISEEHVHEFFDRVNELAKEFTRLPRSGDTVMGFVAAVYRTDHPSLPQIEGAPGESPRAAADVDPGRE